MRSSSRISTWRTWYRLGVAAVCATAVGCETSCPGRNPACEDRYSSTRLVIHQGGFTGERAVWGDAEVQVLGTESAGTGWSLGAVGDAVLVGLPDARAVRLVTAEPGSTSLTAATTASWGTSADGFGATVGASIPDAGGAWDLWVGAPDAATYRGEVHVFDDAPRASAARVILRGPSSGDRMGAAIARCADLTGDRAPDWLIAAPTFSGPPGAEGDDAIPSLAGGAWLIASQDLVGQSGTVAIGDVARHAWWGTTVGARLGAALSCRHDLTGDGFPDLVLGAPLHGPDDAGRVLVLDGADLPASGALGAGWRTLDGPGDGAWFGASVATGDLDGDGDADLLIGAPGSREGTGSALLYAGPDLSGPAEALAPTTTFDLRAAPSDHLGATVAIGHATGDDLADAWVAGPERSTGDAWAVGSLYGFDGRAEWPATLVADEDEERRIDGGLAFQRVGRTLLLHDLDADGLDDVILATRERPSP